MLRKTKIDVSSATNTSSEVTVKKITLKFKHLENDWNLINR